MMNHRGIVNHDIAYLIEFLENGLQLEVKSKKELQSDRVAAVYRNSGPKMARNHVW